MNTAFLCYWDRPIMDPAPFVPVEAASYAEAAARFAHDKLSKGETANVQVYRQDAPRHSTGVPMVTHLVTLKLEGSIT